MKVAGDVATQGGRGPVIDERHPFHVKTMLSIGRIFSRKEHRLICALANPLWMLCDDGADLREANRKKNWL